MADAAAPFDDDDDVDDVDDGNGPVLVGPFGRIIMVAFFNV